MFSLCCRRTPLSQVVITLPGTSVTYPNNYTGDAIRAQLERDGVPLELWQKQAKKFPIKGGYRS
jgi:hypothetical protein